MCFKSALIAGLRIALLAPSVSLFFAVAPVAQAQSSGQTRSPASSKALAAQQALAARDRTFELLGRQSGPVDAPNTGALLGAHDLDGWLWSRYHAVTADSTIPKARVQRLLAGLVHQDLQLAEDALQSGDPVVRRRGLRVATIANIYAGSLTDDPRLQASLYQGFLLPVLDMAPRDGWGSGPALLEGASMAFRLSGRAQEQREALSQLLQMQQAAGNVPGADMARVHMAVALEDEGDLRGAFRQLDAISTPDLAGAKAHMRELAEEIQAAANQGATQPFPTKAGNANAQTPGNTNDTPATPDANGTDDGQTANNGNAGETGIGQLGGDLNSSIAALNGRRLAQNAGGRGVGGQGGGEGGAEAGADDGESEMMRRVRLATEAARKAQQLSKKEGELATISLAKWLDASDAQAALDAASDAGKGRAGQRTTPLGLPNTPQPSLLALQTNAQKTAREASEAAGDVKRASVATQKASAEAARLAMRVFTVDQDTPKMGEDPAPNKAAQDDKAPQTPTATETQIVPQAPAPEVQP